MEESLEDRIEEQKTARGFWLKKALPVVGLAIIAAVEVGMYLTLPEPAKKDISVQMMAKQSAAYASVVKNFNKRIGEGALRVAKKYEVPLKDVTPVVLDEIPPPFRELGDRNYRESSFSPHEKNALYVSYHHPKGFFSARIYPSGDMHEEHVFTYCNDKARRVGHQFLKELNQDEVAIVVLKRLSAFDESHREDRGESNEGELYEIITTIGYGSLRGMCAGPSVDYDTYIFEATSGKIVDKDSSVMFDEVTCATERKPLSKSEEEAIAFGRYWDERRSKSLDAWVAGRKLIEQHLEMIRRGTRFLARKYEVSIEEIDLNIITDENPMFVMYSHPKGFHGLAISPDGRIHETHAMKYCKPEWHPVAQAYLNKRRENNVGIVGMREVRVDDVDEKALKHYIERDKSMYIISTIAAWNASGILGLKEGEFLEESRYWNDRIGWSMGDAPMYHESFCFRKKLDQK